MIKNIKITIPLIILTSGLFAVINTYEVSYSKINNIDTPFESITIPEFDVKTLMQEDEENIGVGVPMRYAHAFDVNYNINNSGTWEETVDGGMLWRLGIHSKDAYGMKFFFNSYWLPEGGKLYFYSNDT